MLAAARPQQVVHYETFSTKSNMNMVLVLLKRGWGHNEFLHESWAYGEAKLLDSQMDRPGSYFACLLASDMLRGKNVTRIPHSAADKYYQILLRCSAEKISELTGALELASEFFDRLLKGAALAGESDPGVVPELEGESQALESGGAAPPNDADVVTVGETSFKRRVCDVGAGTPRFRVYFDSGTHQSGRARAWSTCEEHGCIRYVFCDGFSDRAGACS